MNWNATFLFLNGQKIFSYLYCKSELNEFKMNKFWLLFKCHIQWIYYHFTHRYAYNTHFQLIPRKGKQQHAVEKAIKYCVKPSINIRERKGEKHAPSQNDYEKEILYKLKYWNVNLNVDARNQSINEVFLYVK